MKKRLEAELISIAHRILKLKNKAELNQLYQESQKLYETLSVLKFYEDNFNSVKDEIAPQVLDEKLETRLSETAIAEEPTPEIVVDELPETIEIKTSVETTAETSEVEKIEAIDEEEPKTETVFEEVTEEETTVFEEETIAETIPEELLPEEETIEETITENTQEETAIEIPKAEEHIKPRQISIEELLGNYTEPVFVKPDAKTETPIQAEETPTQPEPTPEPAQPTPEPEIKTAPETPQPQRTDLGISIGLNDRVGYVTYLFNGSNEDFNRVISQLNTCHTFAEAQEFIAHMVKPDYNNWKGLEDYEERFLETIKSRF